MNERQRFHATMHYESRDRVPLVDFSFWDETLVHWRGQGLPESVVRANSDAFFGMDGLERYVAAAESSVLIRKSPEDYGVNAGGVRLGLVPLFDETVLEDRGDYELVQQVDGARVLRKKYMSTIPLDAGHLLTDRESWERHYKPRLDPEHPDRYPPNFDECVKVWADPERAFPLFLPAGSLYGWIRNWTGLENLSMVLYDDPSWFEEMVTTVSDCIVAVLGRVLESGARFEAASMWEDMCYNAGPLMSPDHFKRFLVPHYERITSLLRKHGVDVIWLDCDGQIDALLPLWLEAGVNCMIPIEIGTWGADPYRFRKEYGKDLLMMGGFNKRILAGSKDEIAREVERLAPLTEEGGFIPFCDHRVPPDVPLTNYAFYLETARKVWGKGADLAPIDPLVSKLAAGDTGS